LDPATKKGVNASTGKCTEEKDAKLIDAFKTCGKDWAAVAMLVPGRTIEQCRQQWELHKTKTTCAIEQQGSNWISVLAALVVSSPKEFTVSYSYF
jgi:hypothetical protein